MRRWISEWMDEYVFELIKLAFRGYRKRLPPYRPAAACDMAQLARLTAPADVALTPEPDWRGCKSEAFRFESPVDCLHAENRIVGGRLLTADPGAPWALIIPGYSTGALPPHGYGFHQDVQGFSLLQQGINVALVDLPLHLSRKRPGTGSGEGFFSPDLLAMQSVFRQGAADCIALVQWLRERSGQPVAIWGTSLGGNIGGLVSAHLADLAAVVLMEPLDNPGHVLQVLRSSREIRWVLAKAGISPDTLPEALADVAPSTYQPAVPRDRILFLTGLWDRVIPYRFQDAFWQAWGRPERILREAGHLTMPADNAVNARVAEFLATRLRQRRAAM